MIVQGVHCTDHSDWWQNWYIGNQIRTNTKICLYVFGECAIVLWGQTRCNLILSPLSYPHVPSQLNQRIKEKSKQWTCQSDSNSHTRVQTDNLYHNLNLKSFYYNWKTDSHSTRAWITNYLSNTLNLLFSYFQHSRMSGQTCHCSYVFITDRLLYITLNWSSCSWHYLINRFYFTSTNRLKRGKKYQFGINNFKFKIKFNTISSTAAQL